MLMDTKYLMRKMLCEETLLLKNLQISILD